MIEYDETLGQYIIDHNLSNDTIIYNILYSYGITRWLIDKRKQQILDSVESYQKERVGATGTIFVVPGKQDYFCWAYFSPLSSKTIYKIIKMKVFI